MQSVVPIIPAWLPIITALLGGGLVAAITALLKVIFSNQRQKRAQTDNVALALVEKHGERINSLEAEMIRERENCAREIARIEAKADEDRRVNEALDQLRRHQVNNSKGVMQMTVDLLEVAPDRLDRVIPRLRARLEEHQEIERRDMEAFMGARFGTSPDNPAGGEPAPT
ncbi:MAG: hypothetical protein V4618_00930 [Pseudomonadota bacterium]